MVAAAVDAPVWAALYASVLVGVVRTLPAVDDTALVALLPHLRTGVATTGARQVQVGRCARAPRAMTNALRRPLAWCWWDSSLHTWPLGRWPHALHWRRPSPTRLSLGCCAMPRPTMRTLPERPWSVYCWCASRSGPTASPRPWSRPSCVSRMCRRVWQRVALAASAWSHHAIHL
jgi:hypothetical protein